MKKIAAKVVHKAKSFGSNDRDKRYTRDENDKIIWKSSMCGAKTKKNIISFYWSKTTCKKCLEKRPKGGRA